MNKKHWMVLLLVLILGFGTFFLLQNKEGEDMDTEIETNEEIIELNREDSAIPIKVEEKVERVSEFIYNWEGELEDVTKGADVLGVNTGGNSTGIAKAGFDNGYKMMATFEGLPDPNGTDFYEGWVVRRSGGFNVISSGKLEKIDGKYVNTFESEEDLTDHNFYVLTIEPDDGNPAPADHVLEGTLEKK